MALDGITLNLVCKELNETLVGAKIDKIHQPDRDEVVFQVRSKGANHRLVLSTHPENARLHLTKEPRTNPQTPPMFCMVLRKYLEGGRITEFYQDDFERVITLKIHTLDELSRSRELQLKLEIMGKHSNLILIDPSANIILDGIKRYSHLLSRHREVLPGREYLAPPGQGKVNPLQLTEEQFRTLLLNNKLDSLISKALLKSLDGFSPEACRELVLRASLDLDAGLETCGEYELSRLWQALRQLLAPHRGQEYEPTLVMEKLPSRQTVAFSYLKLLQYQGLQQESFPSLNLLLDSYFSGRRANNRLRSQLNDLMRVLNTELERLGRKLAALDEAIGSGRISEKYRLWGELLTSNLYRLKQGMPEALLEDYNQENSPIITIPLERELTPIENAQYFFRLYNKGKAAICASEPLSMQTQSEISYLNSVKTALEFTDTTFDLAQIRLELVEQGYLKDKVKPGKKEKPQKPEPMRFLSSAGSLILVGKNNKQNDHLTLKLARPQDMWLHVKDMPGSHVIVPLDNTDFPDDATLEEAASLAAHFSVARSSSTVPVDYTHVRNVKKPGGAKPGMVIYENQWTLYITPSAELPEKLKHPEDR